MCSRLVQRTALCLLFAFAVIQSSSAAEESWFSKMNPFDKPSSSRVKSRVTDDSGPNPFRKASSTKATSEPSTWDKMSQGTKSFFGKTKDTLMPWTKDDKPKQRVSATGSRSKKKSQKSASAKKSWFSLPWGDAEPKKDVRDVGDFIAQPRPGF